MTFHFIVGWRRIPFNKMVQPPQLKAAVCLEEPVDSPRWRNSWKLEDTEELQALNSRLEPAEAADTVSALHIASLRRRLSMTLIVHSALCSGTGWWGWGGVFPSVKDHQPHASCFRLTGLGLGGAWLGGYFMLLQLKTEVVKICLQPHLQWRFFFWFVLCSL